MVTQSVPLTMQSVPTTRGSEHERAAPAAMATPSLADWIFSAKTFAAAMVAFCIAVAVNLDRPYWCIATVYIVSQPLSGAMRARARGHLHLGDRLHRLSAPARAGTRCARRGTRWPALPPNSTRLSRTFAMTPRPNYAARADGGGGPEAADAIQSRLKRGGFRVRRF